MWRRIHQSFFRDGLLIPVLRGAFTPNQSDTTGLSVYRERFVTAEETLANIDPEKRPQYRVVRLPVEELRQLGLSVIPEPDPEGPPGHAVIPELSWSAYQADKPRLRDIQIELTELASKNLVL